MTVFISVHFKVPLSNTYTFVCVCRQQGRCGYHQQRELKQTNDLHQAQLHYTYQYHLVNGHGRFCESVGGLVGTCRLLRQSTYNRFSRFNMHEGRL